MEHRGACNMWSSLSCNKALPWSYNFIKKYESCWTWGNYWKLKYCTHTYGGVSQFISNDWTLEQLYEFEKHYDWEFLVDYNPNLYHVFFRGLNKSQILSYVRYIC